MGRRRQLLNTGGGPQLVALAFDNAPTYYAIQPSRNYKLVEKYDAFSCRAQVINNIPVYKVLDYEFKKGKRYKVEITLFKILQNGQWVDADPVQARAYQCTIDFTTPWQDTSAAYVNRFSLGMETELEFTPVDNFKNLYFGFYFDKTTYDVQFGNVYITEL